MQANNEKPLPHALKKHRLMISRCVEGLHMMSSEDAEPFEALSQRNHHVRGSNYGSKTTDLPPRRRPQHSTLETWELSNSDNAHARCVEGLHMMSSEDAEPFEALSQRNHHVRGSNYGSKTTDLPPRRRSRGRLSLGVFPWWEFMWCSLPKWSIVFLSIIVGFFILFFVRLRSLNECEFY